MYDGGPWIFLAGQDHGSDRWCCIRIGTKGDLAEESWKVRYDIWMCRGGFVEIYFGLLARLDDELAGWI